MYSRPYVRFDPTNKKHREYFAMFEQSGKWGDCPVRFVVDNQGCTDLVTLIRRQLILYYTSKEFK